MEDDFELQSSELAKRGQTGLDILASLVRAVSRPAFAHSYRTWAIDCLT